MTRKKDFSVDNKDRMIIDLLRTSPQITHEEIGIQVKLSRAAVQKRVKSLEEEGIIKYAVLKNEKKLGNKITAFILVILDRAGHVWNFTYNQLLDLMDSLGILEFHHVTGDDDVILKMKTRDIDSLEINLMKITQLEGVLRTRTMICLSSVEGVYETKITENFDGPPPKDILWNFT